ncbi:MAG: hypothetical protein LBC74_00130, partial [Planctomycetaceae bacterium]|nr:hypothetical protein [Planctomycetaceae bacterium]
MKNDDFASCVNRGITLLLVLALMTIFSVLVITFMIVTTAAKKMSISNAIALLDPKDREPDSLKDDSNEAIEKIIYGDYDNGIGALSILENLYGNGAVNGTIINFGVSPVSSNLRRIYWNQHYANNLLGHVLTLTNLMHVDALTSEQQALEDKYKNKSVLIKNFGVDNTGNYIDIEKFSDNDVTDFQSLNNAGTLAFIINSPAFSGTGEGFQGNNIPNVPALSVPAIDNIPRVFLPNLIGYGESCMMNPDYTAPDHLTWFLAWYDIDNSGNITDIIPSFHRPKLLNSIIPADFSNLTSAQKDVLKAATLRPLPTEHPEFTGSNTTATLDNLHNFLTHQSNTEWDADNDGDGKKDSIWIDVKLPTFEDRRRSATKPIKVQPLIAVLIRDLDGLLNVNAHGNVRHVETDFDNTITNPLTDGAVIFSTRGSGMGPAEVRLDRVLEKTLFKQLHDKRNITSSSGTSPALVDRASYAGSGVGRLYPDFWGFAPIIFEPMGYRFFDLAHYRSDLYQDNPYMTNVYSNKGNPFGVEQLEPFLRSQNDVDSYQFAKELRNLFNETEFNANRYLITTHSSNIPAMSKSGGYGYVDPTPYSNPDDIQMYNFDSLLARINLYVSNDATYQAIINVLPPEIRRG